MDANAIRALTTIAVGSAPICAIILMAIAHREVLVRDMQRRSIDGVFAAAERSIFWPYEYILCLLQLSLSAMLCIPIFMESGLVNTPLIIAAMAVAADIVMLLHLKNVCGATGGVATSINWRKIAVLAAFDVAVQIIMAIVFIQAKSAFATLLTMLIWLLLSEITVSISIVTMCFEIHRLFGDTNPIERKLMNYVWGMYFITKALHIVTYTRLTAQSGALLGNDILAINIAAYVAFAYTNIAAVAIGTRSHSNNRRVGFV